MSTYFSAERLVLAVERLGNCKAHSRLTDYLIFRRALVIAKASSSTAADGPISVTTGTRSPNFVQAINEWAARTPELWASRVPTFSKLAQGANPYFTPIAAKRDTTKGYRTSKYASNGPSDTVAGWQSQPTTPFRLIQGTKPKAYRYEALTDTELKTMFTTASAQQNSSGELPRLSDLTAWWFRFTDLDSFLGTERSPLRLTAQFREDFDLTDMEISVLFQDESNEQALWPTRISPTTPEFSDVRTEPTLYLPPAAHAATKTNGAPTNTIGKASAATTAPLEDLQSYIQNRGFSFEPWQIATYVSAVRTKPFVILAGISGTGKTKLPHLVAEATGGICETVPVRPDWHDSSELLGYVGLDGKFHPGHLLRFAKRAMAEPEQQFFLVLDEMNIARVEYYLAEVLSRLEERKTSESGRIVSDPFFRNLPEASAEEWSAVGLPGNLCLVGSVNMDETTYGFSKKVLDRGFVIEFSTVNLSLVEEVVVTAGQSEPWGSSAWTQPALALPQHPRRTDPEVQRVIETLQVLNDSLSYAQLQVGYRVRDEVAIFCLEAQQCPEHFRTTEFGTVDPLDIAIAMKVLPRIQGSGAVIKELLGFLLDWASAAEGRTEDPGTGLPNGFPMCEKRLQLMQRRLQDTGFANYWT